MAGLTIDDPVTLAAALTSQRIIPGDILTLLPGTYTIGAGKSILGMKLHGTEAAPITIRPLTKGTVRINGGLSIVGGEASYVTIRDLEIAPTPTTRSFATANNVDFPNPLYVTAPGCKVINNYIHDGKNVGIFGTNGIVFHGNLVSKGGWYTADQERNRDYSIYTHNGYGGLMDISGNLFAETMGSYGMCIWSATSNNILDYHIVNNVLVHAGILVSPWTGEARRNKVNGNEMFSMYPLDKHINLGYYGDGSCYDIEAKENYFVLNSGGFKTIFHFSPNVHHNTIIAQELQDWSAITYQEPTLGAVEVVHDYNTYYNGRPDFDFFHPVNGIPLSTLEEWQAATGIDAHSTYTEGLPAANRVRIVPNSYDDDRAMVAIYNWEGLDSVNLDLTSLALTIGRSYKLHQVQDYGNDVIEFEYDGNPVAIDMRVITRTQTEPTAYDTPIAWYSQTFPRFGAFVLDTA